MTDFILLGNQMCVCYKGIKEKFISIEYRFGPSIHSRCLEYDTPDYYINRQGGGRIKVSNGRWITNIPIDSFLPFTVSDIPYTPEAYPTYENYPAINCDSIRKIPNYDGLIGVPIGILDHYDPEKLTVIDICNSPALRINGIPKYIRVIIKLL